MEKIILSLVVLDCLTNILLAIALIHTAGLMKQLAARLVILEFCQKKKEEIMYLKKQREGKHDSYR